MNRREYREHTFISRLMTLDHAVMLAVAVAMSIGFGMGYISAVHHFTDLIAGLTIRADTKIGK